jgi:amino-acid N-acetyltransferase
MTALAQARSPAIADDALSGTGRAVVIGNFVRARTLGVVNGENMERSGVVENILTESLEKVLSQGIIPIIPCIGWTASGLSCNISSSDIALRAAVQMRAIKLFIVTRGGGITLASLGLDEKSAAAEDIDRADDGRIVRLRPQQAEDLLAKAMPHNVTPDDAGDEASDALSLAVKAARNGVGRVHIIDGREDGAVLRELFSNIGAGTMVYTDEYDAIRGMREQDIPSALKIMEPLMEKGVLIRRTADTLAENIGDYSVYVIDGSVHATGSLHDWGAGQAEIGAVATDPAYGSLGLGTRMVRRLIQAAREKGLKRVFVLTTATRDWFEYLGFKPAPVESLPPAKLAVYNRKRASQVYALPL